MIEFVIIVELEKIQYNVYCHERWHPQGLMARVLVAPLLRYGKDPKSATLVLGLGSAQG